MTAAQAMASALLRDPEARALGFAHGRSGAPWACPADLDLLDYSLGHAEGATEFLCCAGERAQPQPIDRFMLIRFKHTSSRG